VELLCLVLFSVCRIVVWVCFGLLFDMLVVWVILLVVWKLMLNRFVSLYGCLCMM